MPLPRPSEAAGAEHVAAPAVEATYYTDPLCSWSWGFEPELRRLRYEFGRALGWRARMTGLIPSWDRFSDPVNAVSRPLQMGPVCVEVRHRTGQPLDDRVWVENAPASSYPACLAVKAAGLQSEAAAEAVLRRLREAVFLERRDVSDPATLRALARSVADARPDLLDFSRFSTDLAGPEAEAAFRDDLREARYLGLTRTPALTLRCVDGAAEGADDGQGRTLLLVGYRPYAVLRRALAHLAPGLEPARRATDVGAYAAFWGGATEREVAEALDAFGSHNKPRTERATPSCSDAA
jgi:predicted DsbA family dithiol-disulfide isomerase